MNKARFYFLLLLVLSFPYIASAQGGIIYGMRTDSGTATPVYFSAYDCSTFQTTDLYTFPPNIISTSFGTGDVYGAFDTYNGRLFWVTGDTIGDQHVYSFDIATFVVTASSTIYPRIIDVITYDPYHNRVISKGITGLLTAYNFTSDDVDTIARIPVIGYGTSFSENAFNAWGQQYLFTHLKISPRINDDSMVLVNTASGQVVRTASVGYEGIYDLKYDDSLQAFFGFGGSRLYRIDTTTLQGTPFATAIMAGRSNFGAAYDSDHGRYILYYNPVNNAALSIRRLSFFDVTSGALITDTLFPGMETQVQYASRPGSFKLQSGSGQLRALYGQAYQWTFNDTLLPSEHNQTLVPQLSGSYRCQVTFYNDRKLWSQAYVYHALETSLLAKPVSDISVSPNPSKGDCVITFPYSRGETYRYQLINFMGQMVLSRSGNCDGPLQLHAPGLKPGPYLIRLSLQSGKCWTQRLVVD